MTDTPLKQVISNGLPILAGTLGLWRPLDATALMGTVLTIGGVYGATEPIGLGRLFGIPWTNSTNALFVPGIGVRNLACGLTTLFLTYYTRTRKDPQEAKGSQTALAALMLAWTLAGYGDCWILYNQLGSGNMGTHVFNIIVLTVTSFSLFWRR